MYNTACVHRPTIYSWFVVQHMQATDQIYNAMYYPDYRNFTCGKTDFQVIGSVLQDTYEIGNECSIKMRNSNAAFVLFQIYCQVYCS